MVGNESLRNLVRVKWGRNDTYLPFFLHKEVLNFGHCFRANNYLIPVVWNTCVVYGIIVTAHLAMPLLIWIRLLFISFDLKVKLNWAILVLTLDISVISIDLVCEQKPVKKIFFLMCFEGNQVYCHKQYSKQNSWSIFNETKSICISLSFLPYFFIFQDRYFK